MDTDIVCEEGALFRHAILSWVEFSFKVYMNYMARTHYQIADPSLLAGLLPDLPCQHGSLGLDGVVTDEQAAKRLLHSTLPFINPDVDFSPGAYSMVLLQHCTHTFRFARAVYEFMNSTEKPWQCRVCLHLFVVAFQAAGMLVVPPSDLREGSNVAATLWILKTCGQSKLKLYERWLQPGFLVDLPRDLDIYPLTKEETIVQRREYSQGLTYIPLSRNRQPSPGCVSSSSSSEDG